MDTGESMTGLSNQNNQAFDKVHDMQVQLEMEMQQMQDMFLAKFKQLKQKNKGLFKKAIE